MDWREAVIGAVKALGLPYGFTIAIWASGALAIAKYGLPSTREVLFFALGATLGYLSFDTVAWSSISKSPQFDVSLPSAAVLNLIPAIPAIAVSWIIRRIPNQRWGFFCAGFVACFVYIVVLAALLFAVENLLY